MPYISVRDIKSLIVAMNQHTNQNVVLEWSLKVIKYNRDIFNIILLSLDIATILRIVVNFLDDFPLLQTVIALASVIVFIAIIFYLLHKLNKEIRKYCRDLIHKGWGVCADISSIKERSTQINVIVTSSIVSLYYATFATPCVLNYFLSFGLFMLFWVMVGIVMPATAKWDGFTFHRELITDFKSVYNQLRIYADDNLKISRDWGTFKIYTVVLNGNKLKVFVRKTKSTPKGMLLVSIVGVTDKNIHYAYSLGSILEKNAGRGI